NSGMQHRGRNNGYRDWKSIQNTVERNVRYWHLADMLIADWGQSGHGFDIAKCPLMTQSGHANRYSITSSAFPG
ncbi:MAG: hypothetical protein WA716_16825, partial [Pseudolabrys sp.]